MKFKVTYGGDVYDTPFTEEIEAAYAEILQMGDLRLYKANGETVALYHRFTWTSCVSEYSK